MCCVLVIFCFELPRSGARLTTQRLLILSDLDLCAEVPGKVYDGFDVFDTRLLA